MEKVTTWQRFAEITIKTNDLDPMYSVIKGLNETRSRDWMGRFIIYFLCFYDAGGAAVAAEEWTDNYWEKLKAAGQDSTVKRGTERRHFRGKNALNACVNLEIKNKTPWQVLVDLYGETVSPTYTEFSQRITRLYAGCQLGPYFIWKLYDIFNVCLGWPITMNDAEAQKYMPDEPRKAAATFFSDVDFSTALSFVTSYISQFDHPVRSGRCGLAEAETILCMMKGFFQTKSHTIGDDIDDKYTQLSGHPELTKLLPSTQVWSALYGR